MNTLQVKDLYDQIQKKTDARIVDIRSGEEFRVGHIPGALNLPFLRVHYAPGFVPDNRPVILYGSGGPQDQIAYEDAVRLLSEQGVQVSVLKDGFHAWRLAGYPIEKESLS